MSESAGEKTEAPTDHKLEEARKKGQVAQSQDVNKLFVTLAGFEVIIALNHLFLEKLKRLISLPYQFLNDDFMFSASNVASESFWLWVGIIAIILPTVIVFRFIAAFIQFGILMAPESMKMDMQKFDPVTNAKNIFSKKKFIEIGGNLVKAIVLAIVFYQVTKLFLGYILLLPNTDLNTSIEMGITVFSYAARVSLAVFLVIAAIDFILQKWMFITSQKMTKDEVFREYKQMEGDPQIKGERKQLAHELATTGGPIAKQVEKADAVVVNPTHFAVAISYKPGQTPLPILLCKGVDERAQEIIRLAKEYDVPIIRYVSLARTLFRTGREGKFIPKSTLQPMAAVLKAIREIQNANEALEETKRKPTKWSDRVMPELRDKE
jgi:type III secretion protein U